ncbi:unnamed protein product [Arabidopsis thaliana]|uniref:(thale cress) hypothetical protein n=1 Tax=Arabidopsis thaliana TaxID=3702 RepID=A0A7G2EQ90_ARATH|nr:unnamed protein product [Arabidopsis thaliana]
MFMATVRSNSNHRGMPSLYSRRSGAHEMMRAKEIRVDLHEKILNHVEVSSVTKTRVAMQKFSYI